MAKLVFENSEAFFDFVPMLMQLGTANPDILSDDAEEFYMRIDKKIRTELRKYFLANPGMRWQIRRLVTGIESGEAIQISIKPDKRPEKIKYLKENWTPINETVLRHLGVENG